MQFFQKTPDSSGIAIQITPRRIAQSMSLRSEISWIGNIKYINFASYGKMNVHEFSQAHMRAFLKDNKYGHEKELRVATTTVRSFLKELHRSACCLTLFRRFWVVSI